MKKLRKMVAILGIATLFFCTNVFAMGKTNIMRNNLEVSKSKGDIHLQSTDQMASSDALYVVDGTGKYAGYKILKGYPNENDFRIYYEGNPSSYSFTTEDLRKINLNEVISWKFNKYSFKNTKRKLYNFFSDTSQFSSYLGTSSDVLSQEWFLKTFGNTYIEWIRMFSYTNDAETLIEEYFKKTGQLKINDNVTLKPDSIIKVETGLVESNGVVVFKAYDNNGKFLGTYTDGDDTNLVTAKLEKRQELPPKLSDGWVSIDLLKKIYGFDVEIENNNIIFQTDPAVTKYKEFLRLKVPNGWITDDNKSAKVNGVKLKKYIFQEDKFKGQWINSETLNEEFDVYCSIGNTIDEFRLYGSYDIKTYTKKVLFNGEWPSNWQNKDNQKEANINGLRVKRENGINYFNMEDLQKSNIIPESEKTRVIYLNISDLQKIGLIK